MIGASHRRLGGERLVTGAGRFVEDVRVPGMLHAAVLRSPHAHARLTGVDTAARHSGFILSTSCEIPPKSDPEIVRWFMDAAHDYGRYDRIF